MKYHNLRIAWSVTWGVVALLLCVLWVRSYTTVDQLHLPFGGSECFTVASRKGALALLRYAHNPQPTGVCSYPVANQRNFAPVHYRDEQTYLGFAFFSRPAYFYLKWSGNPANTTRESTIVGSCLLVPCWSLIIVTGILSATPWFPWYRLRRFSLRTLLIATTLVAVALGLVVWASR
jgi:hypothetical protein